MDDADYDLAEEWVSDYSDFHTVSNQGSYTCVPWEGKRRHLHHMVHTFYILEFCQRLKKEKKNYFENPHTTYNIFPFCGQ